MRETYKNAFFDAAQSYTCWMGVREPNPLSEQWIGRACYTPKMEACKAKSADNETHRLAGLVVNPVACGDAFRPESRAAAVDTWEHKFLVGGHLPPAFTC